MRLHYRLPSSIAVALALGASLPAFAQDADPDHVCARRAVEAAGDPELVKLVSLSGPKPEIIEYAGTKLFAHKFTVTVAIKGAGITRSFDCWTSEDRRRVLQFRAARG